MFPDVAEEPKPLTQGRRLERNQLQVFILIVSNHQVSGGRSVPPGSVPGPLYVSPLGNKTFVSKFILSGRICHRPESFPGSYLRTC